jgi:hypothetical protein
VPSQRILVDALEIAAAVALGRYVGVWVSKALRALPSHRPDVNGTLRIARFLIAYLAIVTLLWTLEVSHLPFVHQVALVILAGFAVSGALRIGRGAVVVAICSRCGKPMTLLAETAEKVVFGCECGSTIAGPK